MLRWQLWFREGALTIPFESAPYPKRPRSQFVGPCHEDLNEGPPLAGDPDRTGTEGSPDRGQPWHLSADPGLSAYCGSLYALGLGYPGSLLISFPRFLASREQARAFGPA